MLYLMVGGAGCGFEISGTALDASGLGDGRGPDTPDETCGMACPLGCNAAGTACLELGPSNGIDPAWVAMGTVALMPTQNAVIDTDLGAVAIGGVPLTGVVYHQQAQPTCGGANTTTIGVFSFTSITIPEGITVSVRGSNALALIGAGPIVIEGILDVGGGRDCVDPPRCAGPGGFAGGLYDAFAPERGHGPGGGFPGYSANGPGDESGGGGGAACGDGGKGGDAGAAYVGGSGGTTYQTASLVPLCGGSGGGAGGPASYVSDPGARGGGGGGALQLVSATSITISSSSAASSGILASGAGGQGDKAQTIEDGGGGGGGGGAILLEAPTVTIAVGAAVVATGGGGGGGYNSGAIATDGQTATLTMISATGGPGVRRGGNGGAAAMQRGEDAPGPVGDGGAGGGGGAGRIRINVRANTTPTLAGTLSPSGTCATTGVVTTR